MTSKSRDPKALLQTAQEEGELSPESLNAINAINVRDLGAEIQQGLGVSVDDVSASEVVLVTLIIDDSGSIRFAGNTEAVREGHNAVLDALGDSKQRDNVLIHVRYLNGEVLCPYGPLDAAPRMDEHNYDPKLGTPLYDQTLTSLATVLAKTQEFADAGVPARTVTLIVTDGADQHSSSRASAVATVAKDMLLAEKHIIAAMGVEEGNTNFRDVFRDMGIPDQWILTPKNTPSEVRKAFQVFSQSAVRASQGAASFSKTALGGFAN